MIARRAVTPEEMLGFKSVTDAQIAPDGDSIAFVVGDSFIDGTPFPMSSIWTVPTSGGDPRRLTRGASSDVAPRWSPDGQAIAFLSDRERAGQRQVYVLGRGMGEARRLTDVDGELYVNRGMSPLAWSPDGARIAFLMADPETDEDRRRAAERDDRVEFEQHPRFVRMYVADVATGDVACASPDGLNVWEFAWSPDGEHFAAVATDLPYESDWYLCRLVRFPVSGGSANTLHDTFRSVAQPRWSPDGGRIAFTSCRWSDKGMVNGDVLVVRADGGDAAELTAGHPTSYGWIEWSPDGRSMTVAGQEEGGSCIARLDAGTGSRTTLWRDGGTLAEKSFPAFTADRAGNLALLLESGAMPRDVWLARPDSDGYRLQQMTRLHPQAEEMDIGATEAITWKGPGGWDIKGYVVRPPGSSAGERLPLVMLVHGGPMSCHQDEFHAGIANSPTQLLAAAGFAVLLPNPRGSTGRGTEFAESVLGDTGGRDWEDLQAGLDYCVEQGIADPDRLGVTGSSYGGFMTTWAVTHTDRFKAAVASASHPEWRSFHGVSGIQNFDAFFQRHADPYDPDGRYRQRSPLDQVGLVNTPTLLLHGQEDTVCPVDQALQFHRALKDRGVETELVIYPREPHGLRERVHLLDAGRRTVDWFASHLR